MDLIEKLKRIADASGYTDGTDTPLGEQTRAAALEIANYRVLLDGLFHGMPLTPEMPQHVKDTLTNLGSLVYIDGKEGVMRAREMINNPSSPSTEGGK